MTKIFFIIGVGRSGTTLLQNMMNSHPQIAFIPEINYTRRYLFNNYLWKEYNKNKDNFILFLKKDKWIKRLDKNVLNGINLDRINKSNFSIELYKEILDLNCKLNNKSFAGDKDPRSIELVERINKILPNIHWVHIVRDPRDVLLSKMKADWSKNSGILRHVFAAHLQLKLAVKWSHLFPERFTEIYYEDLISNTELTLRNLCKEIGLTYDPKMLDYNKSAKMLTAKDEYAWKKEVFSPIKKDNYSKWEKELGVKSIALIENLVRSAFNNYHYKKKETNPNPLWKVQIILLKPVFQIFSKLYYWKILL